MKTLVVVALLITSTMGSAQWRCTKEGNPFDGYKKIAFVESHSYKAYINVPRMEKLRLEVYQNKDGDTLISITPFSKNIAIAVNGKVYYCFDNDANEPHFEHIISEPLNVSDDDGISLFPPISELIEDLKVSSSFQIRTGKKFADYKFTLKGSSSAIDCALK